MSRLFVYEYTCAALAASVDVAGAAALGAEGEAMLAAVLADFGSIPGVEVFTLRDEHREEAAFRAAVRAADWSLVIAPEFDDLLLKRCRWVVEEGGRLLGPGPDAVALCGDKLQLAHHWTRHGVPTPATRSGGETPPWPEWVVKPRFGAGSQETIRNGPPAALGALGPLIVQEYVAGRAASVAFLCGTAGPIALPAAQQLLSDDRHFHYRGGCLPLPEDLARRATAIARAALRGVSGLNGYVGVDVVLGEDGRDWAIEINPRLTTSYVGLRALARSNLAEAMLTLAEGGTPMLEWRHGRVTFDAEGRTDIEN